MNESITISENVKRQFSARATLVALGVKVRKHLQSLTHYSKEKTAYLW
ncbi:MAG: hypothetical protein JSV81_02265 [Anaerolineales bacterium]|jgi:hypothetical protein|nr:MAG: hypothetical protein JSV81_02265 [Anaerolineales bacterium]